MNRERAERLAVRLLDAFPTPYATRGTADLLAEKIAEFADEGAAERGVEWLVDNGRGLPRVAEIRDAYAAAGGDLYDPGRNMSPGIVRPELTDEQRRDVVRIQREIRELLERGLTRPAASVTVRAEDDERREA